VTLDGLLRKARTFALWTGVVVLVLAVVAAAYLTARLTDDEPVTYASEEDHFKYGSTGGERGWKSQFGFGIPYWVWVALPEAFPEYLPDGQRGRGYTSFGMIYADERDPRFELPIGMSMRRVQGIDRVYFTCAVCHTGTVRDAPDAEPQIVLGMPANTLDFGALGRFLSRAATDWRFRADRMFPHIESLEARRDSVTWPRGRYRPDAFNPVDRLVFRYAGVTVLREQLLTLTARLSFIDFSTWGPGRVDTFNPPKALLGFPMDRAPEDEKLGNVDFPAVWNQQAKEGMQLHWDGNNTSVDERNLSAGFGTGATPTTLDREGIWRIARYLDTATPPPYPAQYVNAALAAEGEPIYRAECWSCHGTARAPFRSDGDGSLVGTVTPIADVQTDRARLDSYTFALAAAQNSLYAGHPGADDGCANAPRYTERCYPARFSHFRKTWGYANMPLDGLWLRAPYLHNGSVPDLRALLEPASARPAVFYTGYDVYDWDRVGFVSDSARASAQGWRYDTRLRGNGNTGHEYGARLTAAQKTALLEYLKTF
jgi:hypothetical protein